MIKPEQVPSEVVGLVGYRLDCTPSQARTLLAEALNAWPGMVTTSLDTYPAHYTLHLPLTPTGEK